MQNFTARRVLGHDAGRHGRMESVGASLKRMLPELVVSKHKRRQAEASYLVGLKRQEEK